MSDLDLDWFFFFFGLNLVVLEILGQEGFGLQGEIGDVSNKGEDVVGCVVELGEVVREGEE